MFYSFWLKIMKMQWKR